MEAEKILKELKKYYKNINKQLKEAVDNRNKDGLKYLYEKLKEIKNHTKNISGYLDSLLKEVNTVNNNPIVSISKWKLKKAIKLQNEINQFLLSIETNLISTKKLIDNEKW